MSVAESALDRVDEMCTPKEGKSNFFKDINPSIKYVTVFETKFSKPAGEEALVDMAFTTHELIERAITDSMKESSKKTFNRPASMGPCFVVNPLYNPRGLKQLCEFCSKMATLCCTKCTVTFYCSWEHQKRDRIHHLLCAKIKMIRWPTPHQDSSLERRRLVGQKLLVMEMLLDDLIHEAYLCIAQKRYNQALGALLQCFKYVMPVYGPRNSAAQMVFLYTALTETYIGMNDLKLAKKMMFSAFGASFKEKDQDRTEEQMTFLNAQLNRTLGLLHFAKRGYKDAILSFSEYIVHLSEAVGPSHIRVSTGYFFLAKSFLALGNEDKGWNILTFCIDMWLYFIVKVSSLTDPYLPELPYSMYFSGEKSFTITRLIKMNSIQFFADIWELVDPKEHPLEAVKLYLSQTMIVFMERRYKGACLYLTKCSALLNEKVNDITLFNLWKHLFKILGRKTKAANAHNVRHS